MSASELREQRGGALRPPDRSGWFLAGLFLTTLASLALVIPLTHVFTLSISIPEVLSTDPVTLVALVALLTLLISVPFGHRGAPRARGRRPGRPHRAPLAVAHGHAGGVEPAADAARSPRSGRVGGALRLPGPGRAGPGARQRAPGRDRRQPLTRPARPRQRGSLPTTTRLPATAAPCCSPAGRILVALAGFLAFACGESQRPTLPLPTQPAERVLLLTLDTTRADRLGAYGYPGAGTPWLDRLAEQGVLFESAVSATPITLPSHVSILTGMTPLEHGVRDNAFPLSPDVTTIAEVFRDAGWRTGAFVGSFVLDSSFGIDQGFETYDAPRVRRWGADRVERAASAVVTRALAWFDSLPPDASYFAWVHFYDPHFPYAPPPPWDGWVKDPYDGEIAFCDAQIKRLLSALESRGRAEKLLVAITADHGESMGEHREDSHGAFLYQSAMWVPLLLWGQPVEHLAGTRVPGFVSNADLAPTLLALSGLPATSLPAASAPGLFGARPKDARDRVIYLETLLPYHAYRWHASRGIIWRGSKLIEGRRTELYALADDPREQRDLAARDPGRRDEMLELLQRVGGGEAAGPAGERKLTPETQRRLEALGYAVAGGTEGAAEARWAGPFDPALPDPHDRIEDLNLVHYATQLTGRWKELTARPTKSAYEHDRQELEGRKLLEEARAALRELQARNADDPQIAPNLGVVEAALGNYDVALPLLEESVRQLSADAIAHTNLANLYRKAGRAEDALAHIREMAARDPRHPRYHRWLADYYIEAAELERAAWWVARMSASSDEPQVRGWIRKLTRRLEESGQELAPDAVSSPEPGTTAGD